MKKNKKQRQNRPTTQQSASTPLQPDTTIPQPIPTPPPASKDVPDSLLGEIHLEQWKKQIVNATLLIAPLLALFVAYLIYSSIIMAKSQESWKTLQSVWDTVNYDSWDMSFKVKDLDKDLNEYVKANIGDLKFLPAEWVKKNKNIDDLEIVKLPEQLRRQVTLQHNISRVKQQLAVSKNTSACPWVTYTLAQLYVRAQQPKEAIVFYDQVSQNFAKHPLSGLIATRQEKTALESEVKWLEGQKLPTNAVAELKTTKKVTVTTSKGKFIIGLLGDDFNRNVDHFMKLAESGVFAGLSFYKVDENNVYSGCVMGTGKSRPEFVSENAEVSDLVAKRGLVVLETNEKDATKTDSRFLIVKRYPGYDTRKKCAIVGKVVDGMPIVENLTRDDIILDISIE